MPQFPEQRKALIPRVLWLDETEVRERQPGPIISRLARWYGSLPRPAHVIAACLLVLALCTPLYLLFSSNPDATSGLEHVLGLTGPVELAELGYFSDGGSWGARLVDGYGEEFAFSIDGRLETATRGAFYIGGTHPTSPGAVLLEDQPQIVEAIYRVVETWHSPHLSRWQKLQARYGAGSPPAYNPSEDNSVQAVDGAISGV